MVIRAKDENKTEKEHTEHMCRLCVFGVRVGRLGCNMESVAKGQESLKGRQRRLGRVLNRKILRISVYVVGTVFGDRVQDVAE